MDTVTTKLHEIQYNQKGLVTSWWDFRGEKWSDVNFATAKMELEFRYKLVKDKSVADEATSTILGELVLIFVVAIDRF